MRKFLLWLGTMWVGSTTLIVVLTTLIGAGGEAGSGVGAFLGTVALWLFALAGGVALSAPAFLKPPEDNGGIWSFAVPLPLWLFLMSMKLASWVGFQVLLGTWMLIFKVWNNHQSNGLPTFSSGPQRQAAGPVPFAQHPAGPMPFAQHPAGPVPFAQQTGAVPFTPRAAPAPAMPPASWQTDPTGRYRQRWWDGARWTDRVTASSGLQATDPL